MAGRQQHPEALDPLPDCPAGATGIARPGKVQQEMNAPAQRSADGRLLPGNTVGIAGARPRNIVTELKIRYENRIPELLGNLFILAAPDKPYMVQIAATKEILDRLVGKPQVTIEATHTSVSVAELYRAAMVRAGQAHANGATVINGGVGAAGGPKEIQ